MYASNKIDTFSSQFVQTITNPQGQKVVYSGDIHISSSTKVAWFYKKPMEKNIYILGEEVTVIEPMLEQAIVSKHNMQVDILKVLQEAKNAKKPFSTTIQKQKYDIDVDKNGVIIGISYVDEFENNVLITFVNSSYNNKIYDDLFEFYIPFNYDIIYK